MIQNTCIAIETTKFPILEGEEEEMVNEGMYGKALCEYLKKSLPATGIEVPLFICEDWGWWVEIKDKGFNMGLCVYSDPDAKEDPQKYAIISSIDKPKKWSWKKFKRIDISQNVSKVLNTVEKIFREDNEIKKITRHNGYPW